MTQGERIKELRKNYLHLTLDKFGERLGVGKSAIGNIESNRRNVTDQMVKSICREFHVNESWLRTGEGEVFLEDNEDYYADIDRIMQGEDETRKNLFKFLIELDDNDLIALRRIMDKALAFSSRTHKDDSPGTVRKLRTPQEESTGGSSGGDTNVPTSAPDRVYRYASEDDPIDWDQLSVAEAEALYKKGISERAGRTGGSASSTIGDEDTGEIGAVG